MLPVRRNPFWEELFKELVDDPESEVFMMGDFNVVLVCQLDRSTESSTPGISATFLKYKEELGLIDIWRKIHGEKGDYANFSYPHNTQELI